MQSLKAVSVVSFELFPRVPSAVDKPDVQYPDMEGTIDRKYQLAGHFVINEETGVKSLELKVMGDPSCVTCYGQLFRDPLVPNSRLYTGFLRCQECDPNGFAPRQWQIELSGVVEVDWDSQKGSFIRGRAYLPGDAAKHSFNPAIRESGIGF